MANPTVEKLKVFGLRHGEKVAMGTVALIFFLCAYSAWSHPSITITPEEVAATAKEASTNLNRKQSIDSIVKELANSGVKPQDFEKKVDAMQAGAVDVSKYKLEKPFVVPEPGAGLIREMPVFLGPTQLYVHAGRGAVRVLAQDDEGNPILKSEDGTKKAPRRIPRAKNAPRSPMGAAGAGKRARSGALAAAEKEKEEKEEDRRNKAGLAGIEEVKKDDDKPEEVADASADKYETVLRGYRFVTAVGKFDLKAQKELYAKALKIDAASADPQFKGLEVQRQELNGDNTWSDWQAINAKKHAEVYAILTKTEDEIVPKELRIDALVDSLPFLEVGYWVGAHPAALVPKALLAERKPNPAAKAGVGGAAAPKGGMRMGGDGAGKSQADYAKMGSAASGGAGYGAGMMKSGAGAGPPTPPRGGRPSGPGGSDFEKSSSDFVMVRALDFDVNPDATYRYRVRIVFANPNYNWESVAPGVDTKSKEKTGAWSPVTAEVNVPADIATYAAGKTPAVPNSTGEEIHFEVVAWNEEDGLTVVRNFDEAPGQVIGSKSNVTLPDKDKAPKARPIDFTSHQLLADATGGTRPASDLQAFGTTRMEVPVLALVVRADGMLVLRDQAKDATSGELAELKAIFEQIKSDLGSKTKKNSSNLGGLLGAGGGGGGLQGAN
jgi:hypothetical protein